MPTRKIGDIADIVGTRPPMPCRHPEHNPPMHMVYENGLWEHVCPGCGHRVVFPVNKPTLTASDLAPDQIADAHHSGCWTMADLDGYARDLVTNTCKRSVPR